MMYLAKDAVPTFFTTDMRSWMNSLINRPVVDGHEGSVVSGPKGSRKSTYGYALAAYAYGNKEPLIYIPRCGDWLGASNEYRGLGDWKKAQMAAALYFCEQYYLFNSDIMDTFGGELSARAPQVKELVEQAHEATQSGLSDPYDDAMEKAHHLMPRILRGMSEYYIQGQRQAYLILDEHNELFGYLGPDPKSYDPQQQQAWLPYRKFLTWQETGNIMFVVIGSSHSQFEDRIEPKFRRLVHSVAPLGAEFDDFCFMPQMEGLLRFKDQPVWKEVARELGTSHARTMIEMDAIAADKSLSLHDALTKGVEEAGIAASDILGAVKANIDRLVDANERKQQSEMLLKEQQNLLNGLNTSGKFYDKGLYFRGTPSIVINSAAERVIRQNVTNWELGEQQTPLSELKSADERARSLQERFKTIALSRDVLSWRCLIPSTECALSKNDVSAMTLQQLQATARSMNLKVGGNKGDLSTRILGQVQVNKLQQAPQDLDVDLLRYPGAMRSRHCSFTNHKIISKTPVLDDRPTLYYGSTVNPCFDFVVADREGRQLVFVQLTTKALSDHALIKIPTEEPKKPDYQVKLKRQQYNNIKDIIGDSNETVASEKRLPGAEPFKLVVPNGWLWTEKGDVVPNVESEIPWITFIARFIIGEDCQLAKNAAGLYEVQQKEDGAAWSFLFHYVVVGHDDDCQAFVDKHSEMLKTPLRIVVSSTPAVEACGIVC